MVAMATKRCPNCQLVNPGSAQSCDCGYSFATGQLGRPLDIAKPEPVSHGSNLGARVLIWILVIAVITIIKIAIRR